MLSSFSWAASIPSRPKPIQYRILKSLPGIDKREKGKISDRPPTSILTGYIQSRFKADQCKKITIRIDAQNSIVVFAVDGITGIPQ
jgi:hypothetical protein